MFRLMFDVHIQDLYNVQCMSSLRYHIKHGNKLFFFSIFYFIVKLTFLFAATKPSEHPKVKSNKKESEFKTAPDGRLIITESSDEEGE